MATVSLPMLELGEIAVGQTAECFAVLAKSERKMSKRNEPYYECTFRAGQVSRVSKVWSNAPCFADVEACKPEMPYRLRVTGEDAYGSNLKILSIAPATPIDEVDGYNYNKLISGSKFTVKWLEEELRAIIGNELKDEYIQRLIRTLLNENRELFGKIFAASYMHHAFASGLLEHVWSLTKVCQGLANHYASYYSHLDPPLNKDVILAAAIVHDIGKLRELRCTLFEAEYTIEGCLLGHVVMGRDLVREAALKIEGFPQETLMLLEHAILSHHGKKEFGAPVLPLTLEALIVSFADDLDAKVNAVARARLDSMTAEPFTEPINALDRRRFYKGIPLHEAPEE